jgi:GntR family transcriptional regulator/MocR family aminotransferase
VYAEARDALVRTLGRHAGALAVDVPDQGMHLTASLADGISDLAIEQAARERGVAVRALGRAYLRAPRRSGLILGFTGHPRDAIERAARRLAEAVAASS